MLTFIICACNSENALLFFRFTFETQNSHITGKWEFNEEEIIKAQMADGKYAILSSNDNLSAKEVVAEYFGKDLP